MNSPKVEVPVALLLRVALSADVNARARMRQLGDECQQSVRDLYHEEIDDAKALYKLAVSS